MNGTTLLTTALAIAGAVSLCTAGDEIPIVHNTAPAEADTAHYELEEMWRAGGFDGDLLIGYVGDALGDVQGNTYLLDTRLYQIVVMDVDGNTVDIFGREGEGPGEFTNPGGFCWYDDGVIAVAGGRIGALEIMDTAGNSVDTLVLSDENGDRIMLGFHGCWRMGDALVVSGNMGTGTGSSIKSEVVGTIFGRDGYRSARVLEFIHERPMYPFVYDEATSSPPWSLWDTLDGRLYVAPQRNRYMIEAYDSDGTCVSTFSRDYDSLSRTEEEIEEYEEGFRERVAEYFPDAQISYMDTHTDVSRVQAGPDGNLWITSSRGGRPERDDVLRIYDVFDTTGRWLRCAELHNPTPEAKGSLIFLSGDRVLRRVLLDEDGGVHGDDTDAETENGVICYRLSRRDAP
jgi:hypothetical protein